MDLETEAYLVTYIIPSVLIFVMLLLASLIACLLTRKRKSIPTSNEEETKRLKGVPVIFQDELEDASYNSGRGGLVDLGTGSRSRSPAILREERPPLPPSYTRRSPPNIDYRNSASNQPSYQPPPPVARTNLPSATRGMRPGAGSAAANYRKPPPYVPP